MVFSQTKARRVVIVLTVCSRQRSGSSDPRGKVCNRLEVRLPHLLLKITSSTIEPLAKQYHADASVKRTNATGGLLIACTATFNLLSITDFTTWVRAS